MTAQAKMETNSEKNVSQIFILIVDNLFYSQQ